MAVGALVVSVIILLVLTLVMVVLLPLCLWQKEAWSQRCKDRAASVRSNDSSQALSPAQARQYPQLRSKLNVTHPLSVLDNGHTTADNLTTPYYDTVQIEDTNVLTVKKYKKKVEIDSEPHYEFVSNAVTDDHRSRDNNGVKSAVQARVTHPIRTATPPNVRKPISAIIRQEDLPRNFTPNTKVPLLPPTPGQTRVVQPQPPLATRPFLNPNVERLSRQPDPPQSHYEYADGLQLIAPPLLKPNLTPAENRPKSYYADYEFANGPQTLPAHYELVQATGGEQAATSYSVQTDGSNHYDTADMIGDAHYDTADMMPTGGDSSSEYAYATPNTRRQIRCDKEGLFQEPARDRSSLYAQLDSIRVEHYKRESVSVGRLIGSGQFGRVHTGKWLSPKGTTLPIAVKVLNTNVEEEQRVKFLQEAAIMGQFRHPNIVKLYGVVTVGEPEMIILELMPEGDLRKNLLSLGTSSQGKEDPELPVTLLSYCRQIASGMAYLSSKAFVHRDLAARNILVSKEGVCKVADFGLARDLLEADYYVSHGGEIPVKWTALEALHYKKYSVASDVWSFGCVMYEIWSLGHKPFENITNLQTAREIQKGYRLPPPPGCPRAMYQLMISCWHPEPSQRPGFTDIAARLEQEPTALLKWSVKDKATHLSITRLGADLAIGHQLYQELQRVYK